MKGLFGMGTNETDDAIEKLEKLKAELRKHEIKRKERAMQAKTGKCRLSSNFNVIQSQLIRSRNIYGYQVDVSRIA